ncbi:hypothetical protein D9619_013175 [Psilocybe cf. subviscida]|uniref:UDENN domain-containing protein n=1 Tax=Psilocybe cf. subviscida TaxID=2480587 RepID=A0A8H5EYZ4_9AGAR|nr:hypothetical protein D9619_013175 [Psilocybe cf. subviscida]
MASSSNLPPLSPTTSSHFRSKFNESDDENTDTASQKSISLSSPSHSRRSSAISSDHDPRQSFATRSSDSDSHRDSSLSALEGYPSRVMALGSPTSESQASSISYPLQEDREFKPVTYPPSPISRDDAMSINSFASTSSRKARPESLLIAPTSDPLILGVALVDFNHLVGPRIEYSTGEIFEDEEVAKILPFLALPDGAHLSAEDYSYFHLVKPGPAPTTIFGISCNQQIAASALLVKGPDVTRSTVQKAVVVLAAKPVFGPIREKLRVVTTALFQQRDFSDYSILDAFSASLEHSLRSQLTDSGFYMGTSIRDLVHTFRQKTLVLVKALMLQKRIMFYGYPVEKLCTYQYSLISLIPGLLHTLDDCGSPPLAARAPTLSRATSLRTSDHKSMLAFMGLPLDLFGKDAFFQPYLPLQQVDMIKDTPSYLCGCTNSIITQQNEIDLLVNTDTGVFEFRDPRLERSAGLTAADRKWMDDILTDVTESLGATEANGQLARMQQFKGSDDYLRSKFEEYISAALSSVKYRDFISKGENAGVIITGGTGGTPSSTEDFNPLWISEFRKTNAYEVWERTTDTMLFDIIEPRHPCNEKPSVVADIGLRVQETIQELKLEQQLAPAREAVARTLTAGSTNFFKAMEGVKGRWGFSRSTSTSSSTNPSPTPPAVVPAAIERTDSSSRSSTPPIEVTKEDLDEGPRTAKPSDYNKSASKLRPFSLTSTNSLPTDSPITSPDGPAGNVPSALNIKPMSAWGANFGSFINSAKSGRFSVARTPTTARPVVADDLEQQQQMQRREEKELRAQMMTSREAYGDPEGSPLFNGASPGVSPTTVEAAPPSFGSVMTSSAMSVSAAQSTPASNSSGVALEAEEPTKVGKEPQLVGASAVVQPVLPSAASETELR